VVPVQIDSNRSFPEAGYFSAMKVYGSEIWGRVCGEFWDDNDAKVACRQLGYYGGFATYQDFSLTDPVLLTELNCEGNEMDLFSCPRNESACYSNTTAAVVCYQNANQGKCYTCVHSLLSIVQDTRISRMQLRHLPSTF
jgi:hypothetical protein